MECDNFSILVWNVRGLDSGRCGAIRAVVLQLDGAVVCLVESKLNSVSSFDINSILGPRFDGFDYLPAVVTRGGIVIAWQSSRVSLDSFSARSFSMSSARIS